MSLDTGHPIISIDGHHDDADNILREWLQKKFSLPNEMINDPNGSEHAVHSATEVDFGFYWGAECEGSLFVRLQGKTQGSGTDSFFELDTSQEVLVLTEAEFQDNSS
jgi:hypothetical protein